MKRFLIHIIDEVAAYQDSEEGYKIVLTDLEEDKKAHTVKTDAFYLVEDEDSFEAIIRATNIIKTSDTEGNSITLAKALIDYAIPEYDEQRQKILFDFEKNNT